MQVVEPEPPSRARTASFQARCTAERACSPVPSFCGQNAERPIFTMAVEGSINNVPRFLWIKLRSFSVPPARLGAPAAEARLIEPNRTGTRSERLEHPRHAPVPAVPSGRAARTASLPCGASQIGRGRTLAAGGAPAREVNKWTQGEGLEGMRGEHEAQGWLRERR